MQESLAAAIIRITDWDGDKVLWDPNVRIGYVSLRSINELLQNPGSIS